jgi:hypothetical protein
LSSGPRGVGGDPQSVRRATPAVRAPLSLVKFEMRIGRSPLFMIFCPDRRFDPTAPRGTHAAPSSSWFTTLRLPSWLLADRANLRVTVASSAASEVTWRSVRSGVVARVLWGLPENIAADIRLVDPWRSLSGPCDGPLRTSTCIVTRQPSAQMTLRPTSAALADIRSQRTMPSACGGAPPANAALGTEPASVPVSFRLPGCSPTTDLARSAVRSSGFEGGKPVRDRQRRPRAHGSSRGHFPVRKRP